MRDKPSTVQTLAGAQQDGALPPINRVRLRAQLGMVDDFSAANIRQATALVLQRVQEYYTVIKYTGPGYVYGRVESTWPSVVYAAPTHNYMTDSWYFQEMGPTHPTCTTASLFEEAGWLCLDTACRVAVYELAREVPEAESVLAQARYAIMTMCADRELSEVNWDESRRRIGTPGIVKVLKRLAGKLPSVQIGKGSTRPVVLSPTLISRAHIWHEIAEWSAPHARQHQAM